MFPSNLTMAGSELHKVGAATEKARVPAFVFTCKEGYYILTDRSCIGFLVRVSI